PGLAAMNDMAAAAGPFAGAARLLEEMAGIRLTAKRVERAAEASGAAVAQASQPAARPAHRRPQDRAASPLTAAGQALRRHRRHRRPQARQGNSRPESKGEDGRARTREVKLAVFFTQDKLDKNGYPARDRDSSRPAGARPPQASPQA